MLRSVKERSVGRQRLVYAIRAHDIADVERVRRRGHIRRIDLREQLDVVDNARELRPVLRKLLFGKFQPGKMGYMPYELFVEAL